MAMDSGERFLTSSFDGDGGVRSRVRRSSGSDTGLETYDGWIPGGGAHPKSWTRQRLLVQKKLHARPKTIAAEKESIRW